jgi:hypothetical protein
MQYLVLQPTVEKNIYACWVSDIGSTVSKLVICGSCCAIKQMLVIQAACDRKVKCVFGPVILAKSVSAVNRVQLDCD